MTEQRTGHSGEVSGNAYLPHFHFVTDKKTEKIFRKCILRKYAGTTTFVEFEKYRVVFKKYPNILFFLLL